MKCKIIKNHYIAYNPEVGRKRGRKGEGERGRMGKNQEQNGFQVRSTVLFIGDRNI
jgi:hypothetical protein